MSTALEVQEKHAVNAKRLAEIGEAIAAACGEGWANEPYGDHEDWRTKITRADGAGIFVSLTWGPKGKISISGCFPNKYHPRGEHHSIGVGETRTATDIGKEVMRRLLPNYLAAYEKAIAQKNATEATVAQSKEVARGIARVLGQGFSEAAWMNKWTFHAPGRMTVEIQDHGYGKIEIRLYELEKAEDLVRQILAILPNED